MPVGFLGCKTRASKVAASDYVFLFLFYGFFRDDPHYGMGVSGAAAKPERASHSAAPQMIDLTIRTGCENLRYPDVSAVGVDCVRAGIAALLIGPRGVDACRGLRPL